MEDNTKTEMLSLMRTNLMQVIVLFTCIATCISLNSFSQNSTKANSYLLNDSHFHLTNYVQEGTDIHKFLQIMGDKVGRVALFGIPLQQLWSYSNTGNVGPTYYLASDDPLYYYSFTDAYIAMTYKSLTKQEQSR